MFFDVLTFFSTYYIINLRFLLRPDDALSAVPTDIAEIIRAAVHITGSKVLVKGFFCDFGVDFMR